MSVQALTWVFEYSEATLGARHVLLSIANHASADGTGAWPCIATIAKEARLGETTVHRAIAELKELGELEVEIGAGPHGTNLYTLTKMLRCQNGGVPISTGRGAKCDDKMAPEPSLTVLKQPSKDLKAIAPSLFGFELFWQAYPRKVKKPQAKKAWLKQVKGADNWPEFMASLERWKACEQWSDVNFIPYPATFLNGRQWEDEPPSGGSKREQSIHRTLEAAKRVLEDGPQVDSASRNVLPAGDNRRGAKDLLQGLRTGIPTAH